MSDIGQDENEAVRELAEQILGDAWDTSSDEFDSAAWSACEQAGLTLLTLPEGAGGSGAGFADAAAVLTAAGEHAARVPLVETDLLAAWALHAADLPVPAGPLSATACPASGRATSAGCGLTIDESPSGVAVSGTLPRVPWGRAAGTVVVLAGDRVLAVDTTGAEVRTGRNVASEPRDDLVLDGAAAVSGCAAPGALQEFELRAALGRSLLIAGAARGALGMAVRYAGEREQFGRPLARLQSVQQSLATAGAEVAAAVAVSQAAAQEADQVGVPSAAVAVAAAKYQCSAAAGEVAAVAHQVHGAIGITLEHDLRVLTTRLWAWRDEDDTDAEGASWDDLLGAQVLAAGPDGVWPMICGAP